MPPFGKFFLAGLLLAVIGWGGLAVLFVYTLPYLGPRWLFFFLFMMALTGTALPMAGFLNLRFPSIPPVEGGIVVRQAIWVGIYGCLLAWLQLGKILNLAVAIFLAIGFILIEYFLRLRERARFQPKGRGNE